MDSEEPRPPGWFGPIVLGVIALLTVIMAAIAAAYAG